MQYILVPEIGAASVAAIRIEDLIDISQACVTTALCSVQDGNPWMHDSAILFNLHSWRGHYMKMCAYGLMCLDEMAHRLTVHALPSLPEWEGILTGVMQAWGTDPSEKMIGPAWIYSPEVIKSHRRYLIHLNYMYRDIWDLSPTPLPVPVTGPDVYAPQTADI